MNMEPGRGILLVPGVALESILEVRNCLQRNKKFDAFFNDRGFHNHLMHHVLAAYSLGASADTIKKIFDVQASTQRLIQPITDHNPFEWGKIKSFPKAQEFFLKEMNSTEKDENGIKNMIIKHVFNSKEHMLSRMLAGLFHPFINIGYGVEFNLPMMVVDGLAQAACSSTSLVPILDDLEENNTSSTLEKVMGSIFLDQSTTNRKSFFSTFHEIENEISRSHLKILDIAYQVSNIELEGPSFEDVEGVGKHPSASSVIKQICQPWETSRCSTWSDVVEKVTEILFLAPMILAATNKPGKKYRQDFFFCHILTSSMFLPSFVDILPLQYCFTLVHAYLRSMLTSWISRGPPPLNIAEVLMKATKTPKPTKNDNNNDVNPWFAVMEYASTHNDEHVVKAIRALALYSQHFSHLPAFQSTHGDYSNVDGSIFIRAAGILLTRTGWGERDPTKGSTEWDFDRV